MFIAKLVATGLYSGYMRPFSGTWGTIPAWALAFFLLKGNLPAIIIVTLVVFVLSVWSATEAEKMFGHDSKNIVIDEWAGMLVTLIAVPYGLNNYIVAFIMFRVFDVIKIPPAAQFEKLPGGWGVTMDDIAAGVYANIFTQLFIWLATFYQWSWFN